MAADGGYYAIGVYSCRNTCSRLAAEGLTTRSFVSGMSTGYSGNLGFALPDNWAFDQIANRDLSTQHIGQRGDRQRHGLRPRPGRGQRDPNDGFYTLLHWLEARTQQWRDQGHLDRSGPELVAEYFQNQDPAYGEPGSGQVFGGTDHGFLDFVASYPGIPDTSPLRDPKYLWDWPSAIGRPRPR
ncbi:glycoside hydrolase domain-containing protein [Dactylosporangium sp. NPDC049140]|uniref:glycoside hydrolase domain-containing protein n=1 Tax=Dactylosporangium sp. NPDC049140 TaxID=3155647 RepID=UPI0033D10C1C